MECVKCGHLIEPGTDRCPECGEGQNLSDQSTQLISKAVVEPPSEDILTSGMVLNERFRVKRRLGRGGMGQIYLAEDLRLKRNVAIKCIHENKSTDPKTRARFLREAQVISKLEHSNICSVYEFFEVEGMSYFVMQYIDGVTLTDLTKDRPLSMAKVIEVGIQICEAMVEAHDQGILHRDLKPSNIMINRRGNVVVLDFGLAKYRQSQTDLSATATGMEATEQGVILGTVPYMSPEQARGEPLDDRSDIFSFGTLLFECIEGYHPFLGNEQIETLYNVLKHHPDYSSNLPVPIRQILEKALSKDPESRYGSFREISDELRDLRGQASCLQTPTPAETRSADSAAVKRRTSDSVDLSQMVRNMKTSVGTTTQHGAKKQTRFRWYWALPLVAIALVAFWLVKHGPFEGDTEIHYVLLETFDNQSDEPEIASMLHVLLAHSMNQFPGVKVLTRRDLGLSEEADFLEAASAHFDVSYVLSGKIEHDNVFAIDAFLTSVKEGGKDWNSPAPGTDKDKLLTFQVDFLTRDLYHKITGNDPKDQHSIQTIFGSNWADAQVLMQGIHHFDMFHTAQAEKVFRKVDHLPIARYYLANIYQFNGLKIKALDELNAMSEQMDVLTPELLYRTRALRAGLEFNFVEQKHQLALLQNLLPFSKEVHYELGEAYFHMGLAEQAKTHYLEALKIDSGYSKAINHLGYCYAYLGQHDLAIECFQNYRRYDGTANSYDSLGDGYFYAGQLDLAIQFKTAAVHDSGAEDEPWAFLTLADSNVLLARFLEAEGHLNSYLEIAVKPGEDPSYYQSEVWRKFAYIDYLRKDFTKALNWIDRSLQAFDSTEIRGDSSESHWLRGLICLKLKKFMQARHERDWLLQVVQQHELSEQHYSVPLKYYLHLDAMVEEQRGDSHYVEEQYKRLLGMMPQLGYWTTPFHYPFFQTQWAHFNYRHGRFQEALECLDTCFNYDANYLPALWLLFQIQNEQKNQEANVTLKRIKSLYGEAEELNPFRQRLADELRDRFGEGPLETEPSPASSQEKEQP